MLSFKKYASLLLTLVLTACVTEGEYDCPTEAADGDAYLSINIPISQSATRAVSYDNGMDAEFQVHDFILVLFKGTDVHKAYKITVPDKNTASGGQVNAFYNYVVKVNSADMADAKTTDYYAMAILNANGQFQVSGTELQDGGGTSITTFSQLQSLKLTNVGNAANGFLMTNAPVSSLPGGEKNPTGATVSTLAKIDGSKIYTSEQIAKNIPAADIYVERAAVKVQVIRTKDGMKTMLSSDLTTKGITDASVPKWELDNYNTQFFPMRKVSSTYLGSTADGTTYRMVAPTTLVTSAATSAFRIHWGEGINYNGDGSGLTSVEKFLPYRPGLQFYDLGDGLGSKPLFDRFDHTANYYATSIDGDTDAGNTVYCAENTLAADNMKQDRTTRVIIGIQFTTSGGNYTTAEDPDKFVSETAAQNYLKKIIPELVKTWAATYVDAANRDAFVENTGNAYYTIDGNLRSGDRACRYMQLSAVKSDADIYVSPVTKTNAKDKLNDYLKEQITTKYKVLNYAWNQAYYPIRIKHFGNDETPWTPVASKDYDTVYPVAGRDNKYLGRYGVLRNTWYQIKIKSINHIGSNVYPVLTDDPDDEGTESWIDYDIVVLPWAVHTQNFDF